MNEFKKYLYIVTEKAMESGEAEDLHYEGRKEEIAKILQYSRIRDLIKRIREDITAQEIYKQKEEYD